MTRHCVSKSVMRCAALAALTPNATSFAADSESDIECRHLPPTLASTIMKVDETVADLLVALCHILLHCSSCPSRCCTSKLRILKSVPCTKSSVYCWSIRLFTVNEDRDLSFTGQVQTVQSGSESCSSAAARPRPQRPTWRVPGDCASC
jgi:hypothetical protein